MPVFSYTARDNTGRKVEGTLQAASRGEVLATLGKQALFPLSVQADQAIVVKSGRRIKPLVMATMFEQLSSLLRSGVPLLRSLDLLRRQSTHAGLSEVLTQIHRLVEDGTSLPDAMSRYPKAFSEMAISMAKAGSEGGFLEDALARVATFTEQQEDLKSRTAGAMAYPILLFVAGTIIVTVLIVYFVPSFEHLFQELREKGELPAITEWLLALSHFVGHWGWLMLTAMFAGGWYARRKLSTEEGRLWLDKWKLRVPLMGPISQNLAIARLCRVLGTLLHNGVPILRSLSISASAAGNRLLAKAIVDAGENVSSGESLSRPLAACKLFPPSIVEMISVAEEANTLESVLTSIADNLERRTWRQLDLAVRLLEPLMLMVMAGIVLCVVIALILPVLKMSTTM
jgi:general secretion pathway protein F/type IV pilus assembly protein PilC